MRILCLHGRGSNNEIFQLQTASFRSDLADFEFDFVQGTVLHTEGNWSLYTTSVSKSPLYAYYDPLSPTSIRQAEDELLQIIEEDGPFDGVLGYSAGAALAAQIIIRDAKENPYRQAGERPFRFAIFINGATPLNVFKLTDADVQDVIVDGSELVKEAEEVFLRASATRRKAGVEDAGVIPKQSLNHLQIRLLSDGTQFAAEEDLGFMRHQATDTPLIEIPTLHIRCKEEEDEEHGAALVRMCDSLTLTEFSHKNGHDFPRGHKEMKRIAELIRETAERA